jgi:hypothetical protein
MRMKPIPPSCKTTLDHSKQEGAAMAKRKSTAEARVDLVSRIRNLVRVIETSRQLGALTDPRHKIDHDMADAALAALAGMVEAPQSLPQAVRGDATSSQILRDLFRLRNAEVHSSVPLLELEFGQTFGCMAPCERTYVEGRFLRSRKSSGLRHGYRPHSDHLGISGRPRSRNRSTGTEGKSPRGAVPVTLNDKPRAHRHLNYCVARQLQPTGSAQGKQGQQR